MNHHEFADITGTLTAPALPWQVNGAPRVSVTLKAGDCRVVVWSAQASHTPIPFRMLVDRDALGSELQIEADCVASTGSMEKIASCSQPLLLNEAPSVEPQSLELHMLGDVTAEAPQTEGVPDVVELSGTVSIPENLIREGGCISFTVLVVQDDGQSNLYSSNIAEQRVFSIRPTLPFAFTLDRATVPQGHRVKLAVYLYDQDHTTVVGGRTIKDIDLSDLPDLSDIVLGARRN